MTSEPLSHPPSPSESLREIWLPIFLTTSVGVFLTCSIWAKTGDILGDFGNEQYVAWQISQGKILFRDVAYLYGPLSPDFNGLIAHLAGNQLDVILTANLVVLILTTALLYRLLRVISGMIAALTATIFFLFIFALNCPTKITNYDFLTPYSHSITHGFLLTLGVIACLYRFRRTRSTAALIFGGFMTGAVFLTKPEIFLGCAASYFFGLAAVIWLDRNNHIGRIAIYSLSGTVALPLAFLFFYAAHMPFNAAARGVLGGWQFIGQPLVTSTPFYKGDFGIDQPMRSLALMFQYAGFYLAFAVALTVFAVLVNNIFKSNKPANYSFGILLGAACFVLLMKAGNHFESFWQDAARGLPLFAAFALVISARQLVKARADSPNQSRAVLQFSFSILSFVFLGKILLNARMYHYGFVLAAPCTMLIVVAFLHWLPQWIGPMGGSAVILRLGFLGVLAAFVAENVTMTNRNLKERTLPIPLALGGVARTRPLNAAAVDAIKWLSATNATAAVIPDAAGINYAAARPSSIPFTEIHPMALAMFGEQTIVAAFDRSPPQYILLMHVDEQAFGAHTFGRDYGLKLDAWIDSHYRYTGTFSNGRYPIDLWKRFMTN
jgi:hypothetical protein